VPQPVVERPFLQSHSVQHRDQVPYALLEESSFDRQTPKILEPQFSDVKKIKVDGIFMRLAQASWIAAIDGFSDSSK
jgi:hypothetical protein